MTANSGNLEEKQKMGYVKNNKKTKSEIWLTIICIVLVAVVVLSILSAALSNMGVFIRISDAVSTENFEVNGAMLSYFYNEEIRSWISNNATYIQYAALYPSYFGDYSVDFTSNLDSQQCKLGENKGDDYTWYDYFMDLTVESVSRYVEYAEGALKAGVALDDDDNNEITESLNTLIADLKANGYGLEDVYGNGVGKSDIKKCYELKQLAIKYAEIKIEELKGELEKDDADVIKYPEDHRDEFYSAKYLYYTIQVKEANYKTSAEFESAKAEAKSAAELIAKAETPEKFYEAIVKYEEESSSRDAETATETESTTSSTTSSTTAATTEETTKTWEDYTKEVYENTDTDELNKWLFGENIEEGATKVIEETETVTTAATTTSVEKEATSEESTTAAEGETTTAGEATTEKKYNEVYKVSAYRVVKKNDLNKDKTFGIGYVITNDKEVAERIYKDFEAGSSRTAEILKKLGEAEAEKLGEDSKTTVDAGTQDNAMPEFFSNYSDDLDEWLNSDTLKAGDYTKVEIAPTTDGGETQYAIVFYEKEGHEVWYSNAFDEVMDDRFEGWYELMKKEMPIETKEKTLRKMTVSTYIINYASQIKSSSTTTATS